MAGSVGEQPARRDVELGTQLWYASRARWGPATVMTMDAGYGRTTPKMRHQGIDAYIATRRLHGQPPRRNSGPLPRNVAAKPAMARKIRSKKGAKIYAHARAIVEPFERSQGSPRSTPLSVEGIEKVSGRMGT